MWFSSGQLSYLVMSDSLRPHGLQHAWLPFLHQLPEIAQTHIQSSRWCHPTISPSVVPFSSCLQSFPTSGSFPMSQFFTSGGQSIWVSASASVLPMNIQDWFPLGLIGLISLKSKGYLSVVIYPLKRILPLEINSSNEIMIYRKYLGIGSLSI